MSLWAPYLLRATRWMVPTAVIMSSTATYLSLLASVRILTIPLPESYYRAGEQAIYSAYQSMIGFFFEKWSGVEFCYYGDPLPTQQENVLYLCNHQCTVDWIVAEILCVKQGGCFGGGRTRYILKDSIKYLPMFGWQLGARGGMYISKEKLKDPNWMKSKLRMFQEQQTPLWLVLFPEGTRFNQQPHQLERSWNYADGLGLPHFNNVLTPRTMGFELAVDTLHSYFDAVYDITVVYEGVKGHSQSAPTPNMFEFFSGWCRRVHIHLRRIAIKDVPQTSQQQKQWLYNSFINKETIINELRTTGSSSAPKQDGHFPLSLCLLPTALNIGVLAVAAGTRWGRWWWASVVLLSSVYGLLAVRKM